jgi:diguanylate cyclase (GGDEF)-like protein/putative nucleotidyltransferase with HDIG domain
VVIQAEAGRRRGALGRRLALGETLVGLVARSGQVCVSRELDAGVEARPVLEDSASAIALPIAYADQLHGVLYVETAEPCDFSEEDVLLLNTLADLISGALYNAITFQKAQEQAITDGLTGVKTHRFLMEALSAEWKRSTRAARAFSLVLIDLDRFKFVNDFYGHLEGDLVLNRVGHILEQNCRRSDVVARYGGDEFVILMPETDVEQGRPLAEKLRAALCADTLLRDKNISASFGIATFPVHGSTPQELIQVADASMYLSKHKGGNAVSTAEHFDPNESKKWKRDVLEAYLGVTLKRLFSTGPEAFAEIRGRLEQFAQSLAATELSEPAEDGRSAQAPRAASAASRALPPSVIETVSSLSLAIDAKDHYTHGHSKKVAVYAALIAERLGFNEEGVAEVHLGGLLHDIGKVGIPENILSKNGPLDPEEWDTMKRHVWFGEQLLEPLHAIAGVRQMVRHHHEMFDGSGYPEGLAGEGIPLGARIIAVADAYDTITSERTYKKARPGSAALDEIKRCAGAQFDPEIVRVFLAVMEEPSYHVAESTAASTSALPR